MNMAQKLKISSLLFIFFIFGCKTQGNVGSLQSYTISEEPLWIRNGEPIEFEQQSWYPADGVESLLDSEVQLLGEYRGTQFFVEKIDVRPYNRLYTKFGRNKFRIFQLKKQTANLTL